jgi:hypothetical protein
MPIAKQIDNVMIDFDASTNDKHHYTHSVALSDGSILQVRSRQSALCSYSIETFKQEGEHRLYLQKLRERYQLRKVLKTLMTS